MGELLLFVMGAIVLAAAMSDLTRALALASAYTIGWSLLAVGPELHAGEDGALILGAMLLAGSLFAAAMGHKATRRMIRAYRGSPRRCYYS